ncbi:hypothetical protein FCL47_23555 [Desulfopila sp. IMCC35006]|uniref:BT4734/BF3469 family protein n=1 Tax=Desulfopila sp. IMCC35006 TaxID=2569542 RepID=UPI0010AB6244|nr:BT4734/BF3469 family protein [Desulfopila sp. IMCC35006]TKB23192.1 hypothetical protein FCL47_23555 [Desulfopila sp. IMCC35006]
MKESIISPSTSIYHPSEISFRMYRNKIIVQVEEKEIIADIKSGKYKQQLKKIRTIKDVSVRKAEKFNTLPMMSPCVVLSDVKFNNNEYVRATGNIQFDIDLYDNQELINEIKTELLKLPSVRLLFESPNGGLKFQIKSDFACDDKDIIKDVFPNAYLIAENYILSSVPSIPAKKLDQKCKDVDLGCYVSFDPNIYFNADADVFHVNESAWKMYYEQQAVKVKEEIEEKAHSKKEYSLTDIKEALAMIPKNLSRTGNNGINRFSISLSLMRIMGISAIDLLYNHWDKKDRKDLEGIYNSRNKKSTTGKDIKPHTFWKAARDNGYKDKISVEVIETGIHARKLYTDNPGTYQSKRFTVSEGKQILNAAYKKFFESKNDLYLIVDPGFGKSDEFTSFIADMNSRLNTNSNITENDVENQLQEVLHNKMISNCTTGKNILIFVKDRALQLQLGKILYRKLGNSTQELNNDDHFFKMSCYANKKVQLIQGMSQICRRKERRDENGALIPDDYSLTEEQINALGPDLCSSCNYGFGGQVEEGSYIDGNGDKENLNLPIACSYLLQFSKPVFGSIRIYTFNYITTPSRFDKCFKPDFIGSDEYCLGQFNNTANNTISFFKKDLPKTIQHIWDDVKVGEFVKINKNYLKSAQAKVKKAYLILKTESDINKSIKLKENYLKVVQQLKFAKDYNREYVKRWISTVEVLGKNGVKISMPQLHVGRKGKFHPKWDKTPKVFLDGSGNEVLIHNLYSEDIDIVRCKAEYNINAKIIQVINKTFSKASFNENPNTWVSIKSFLNTLKGKTAVISYKKFADDFYKIGVKPEDFMWFGNLRGSNRFEQYDNLVVIGRHYLPYTAMNDLAMLTFDDIKSLKDIEMNLSPDAKGNLYRHSVDCIIETPEGQQNVSIKNHVPVDSRLLSLYEQIEVGEIEQAVMRLRLIHGIENKTVYLLTNVVTGLQINETVTWSDLVGGYSASSDIKNQIFDTLNKKGFIQNKNNVIAEATGCEITKLNNFRKNNMDWFESFKIVKVKVTILSRKTNIKEYLVSDSYKGNLKKDIMKSDTNIKNAVICSR